MAKTYYPTRNRSQSVIFMGNFHCDVFELRFEWLSISYREEALRCFHNQLFRLKIAEANNEELSFVILPLNGGLLF